MGKIFYVIGKSSTGKDTIYKELMEDKELNLRPFVTHTTRPMREGEKQGVEYFFTDQEGFKKLKEEGKVIEVRTYHTVHGDWNYFTADSKEIDLKTQNYCVTGVLESFCETRNYYGEDKVIPIYVMVEDGERLTRALAREKSQTQPRYEEMCRRFLTDSKDFSKENIEKAKIEKQFLNKELKLCVEEIKNYINEYMEK